MKLYWHPFSIFPRRVEIALREKGISYEKIEVDLPGGAHRRAEFRRLNPFAQGPSSRMAASRSRNPSHAWVQRLVARPAVRDTAPVPSRTSP